MQSKYVGGFDFVRDVLSEHGSAIDVMMRYVLSGRSTNGMLLPSLLSPNFLICTSVSDEIRRQRRTLPLVRNHSVLSAAISVFRQHYLTM
ncbi:hypothetical protein [Paenibacillus sp. FSL P4-0184]|uniref:hypothetical protein n=1 Tax=Paenibacillus sp. FSL P4-0184 TaxID=2921632 RepID=UPI0030F99504